jgi:hypothetical protein
VHPEQTGPVRHDVLVAASVVITDRLSHLVAPRREGDDERGVRRALDRRLTSVVVSAKKDLVFNGPMRAGGRAKGLIAGELVSRDDNLNVVMSAVGAIDTIQTNG